MTDLKEAHEKAHDKALTVFYDAGPCSAGTKLNMAIHTWRRVMEAQGWVLVPKGITDDMLNAAQERLCELENITYFADHLEAAKYDAMISARPTLEGEDV